MDCRLLCLYDVESTLELGKLTRMPSHRETARNGLSARSVRIERKAGISAAPAKVAAKLTSES